MSIFLFHLSRADTALRAACARNVETTLTQIEDAFRSLTTRGDISILMITQAVRISPAHVLRHGPNTEDDAVHLWGRWRF